MSDLLSREYRTIKTVKGPLIFVEEVRGAAMGEMVSIDLGAGETRDGQVIELEGTTAVIQIFGLTEGISPARTIVNFSGRGASINLSPLILGRIFSGGCIPIDGQGPVAPRLVRDVNGSAINPVRRDSPRDYIETGVSAIDGLNTLVRGQKLPVFSGAGLPANEIVSGIIQNANVPGELEAFAVVFAGMGITALEADFFRDAFVNSAALEHSVVFLNLAEDPVVERLLTPRYALTAAEYLAFDLDMHVLVVLTDMTQYCNALREVSSSREEIPGRRGYPGYMYTDLASIYERAGRIKDLAGSVTQMPVLTMPDDDITHPIADLTGYITEGQITLDRDLQRKGVFPPINVLPSLSRLMNQGIGKTRTREDHRQWADQLYMCYARGVEQRDVAAIIGEEGLGELDRKYLAFADRFEKEFVNQRDETRTLADTLEAGWRLLDALPESELVRVDRDMLKKYRTPAPVDGP